MSVKCVDVKTESLFGSPWIFEGLVASTWGYYRSSNSSRQVPFFSG